MRAFASHSSSEFNSAPFALSSANADKIARYCTEDNTQDRVVYNEGAEVELTVFKSILRHIIGSYELVPDDVVAEQFAQIKALLTPKKRNICETFVKVMKIKEDAVTFDELKTNLKANELKLDKMQLTVMQIVLYKESGNADELPYKLLFD